MIYMSSLFTEQTCLKQKYLNLVSQEKLHWSSTVNKILKVFHKRSIDSEVINKNM